MAVGVTWQKSFACAIIIVNAIFIYHLHCQITTFLASIKIRNDVMIQPMAISNSSKTFHINLLGKPIGTGHRICNNESDQDTDCWITIQRDMENVNGPMPLRIRPWMAEVYQASSTVVYVSSHTSFASKSHGNLRIIAAKAASSTNQFDTEWKELNVTLSFDSHPCKSLHSPSIVVDDQNQRLYMYIHGHHCELASKRLKKQPTWVYSSHDGLHWSMPTSSFPLSPLVFRDLFYMSVPVFHHDGYYYCIAKTQEDSVGSAVLCRGTSFLGPWEQGQVLGKGLRHADIHIRDNCIYVFFTMIGDSPERILLGDIEMSDTLDWTDWKLLPGPILLEPEYFYEHGNAQPKPSEAMAGKGVLRELRDPHFLSDQDSPLDSLNGLLFHTVQGEQGIAVARISVNTSQFQNAVRFRNKAAIDARVLEYTSLVKQQWQTNATRLLITGTGRSGTTFLCTYFQLVGIDISHDNSQDCGPYPGSEGAVSWYDAFDMGMNRTYDVVIQIVRDPLKVIYSRVAKINLHFSEKVGIRRHTNFWKEQFGTYEEWNFTDVDQFTSINENNVHIFSLMHWVRRNSFVQKHAAWRMRIEDISTSSGPLHLWSLCMAGQFGPKCPNLMRTKEVVSTIDPSINTRYHKVAKADTISWENLAKLVYPLGQDYILIAQKMAVEYGYEVENFDPDSVHYDCWFLKRPNQNWDCWLVQHA